MHPILAQRERLAVYFTSWLPVAGLLAALVTYTERVSWIESLLLVVPLAAVYSSICLSSWYLCRAFSPRETGMSRLIATHSVAAILSSSLWLLIGRGWALFAARVFHIDTLETHYLGAVPVLFGVGILLFVLAVAVHYLLIAFEDSRAAERRALEMKVLAREAELKALKAQIDPHFLFNSLNSVSALIAADPAGARRMCILLAEFLRKSLNLAALESITLQEELSLLASYLNIEQIRFGSRLKFQNQIEDAAKNCLVPPLLLQPLIENAVNHGISHLIEGGEIRIAAERRGERLRISIENPTDPLRPATRRKGLGLENVRNRLRTLYRSEGFVEAKETEGRFHVELLFPAYSQIEEASPSQTAVRATPSQVARS